MVFESLTLVELNLENAHIAPSLGGREGDVPTTGSDGSRVGLLVGAVVVLAVAAAVAARRLRTAGDDDPGRISIEQAAEQ